MYRDEYTAIETFLNYQDASTWLEGHMRDIPDDYYIFNASINFINNKWRAGISYGARQGEFLLENQDNETSTGVTGRSGGTSQS